MCTVSISDSRALADARLFYFSFFIVLWFDDINSYQLHGGESFRPGLMHKIEGDVAGAIILRYIGATAVKQGSVLQSLIFLCFHK